MKRSNSFADISTTGYEAEGEPGHRNKLGTLSETGVRSHIGIPGNEKADQATDWQSHLGPISAAPTYATYEGLRAHGKAIRKELRAQPSLGMGRRTLWSRKALSAYTWMRTNRGPQLEWLFRFFFIFIFLITHYLY